LAPAYARFVKLLCEIEGRDSTVLLPGDGAALMAFMSFAVTRGFGATHPLIALAERVQHLHRAALGPLTTFYDRNEEDSEDREKRELTWLPAANLAAALRTLETATRDDAQSRALLARAGAEDLPSQAAALAAALETAPAGARARIGYEL
jgi:hypothetical protein